MQKKYFTVRDSKAEIFHPPFLQHSHAEAERTFAQLVQDQNSQISKYPEDYDLYYLGIFDDITGTVETLESPQHMVKAIHLVKNN